MQKSQCHNLAQKREALTSYKRLSTMVLKISTELNIGMVDLLTEHMFTLEVKNRAEQRGLYDTVHNKADKHRALINQSFREKNHLIFIEVFIFKRKLN